MVLTLKTRLAASIAVVVLIMGVGSTIVGTRLFGTIDRFHCAAAGQVGFRIPAGLSAEDLQAYDRFREIPWSPALGRLGHHGGHTSWASVAFLRRHLPSMLEGGPALPVHELKPP